MRRWLTILMPVVLLTVGIPTRPAQAQAERCFPETGTCMSGRFRQYWEQYGGLPVFGYPVTAAANAANRDTGQTYLTQWFERNRFELHPENQPPYDVLLGRLGDDRLGQLDRDWHAEGRESGPAPGCLWFEQTGHNVCNQDGNIGFRAYWERNGLSDPTLDAYGQSLALFGLPLTVSKLETNVSGDRVITQWFERARLEWHSDNAVEYTVLLGLLGVEARPAAPHREQVEITQLAFNPETIQVAAGTTVEWKNEDDLPHTVTHDSPAAPGSAFASPAIPGGDSFAFTFRQAGEYPYFCTLHPSMRGRVIVSGL